MADILLLKVLNGDINLEPFSKWLLSQEEHDDFKCSQADFLTYFLNFVHEEIPCRNKFVDSPANNNCPKTKKSETRIEKRRHSIPDKSLVSNSTLEKSLTGLSIVANTSTPKYSKIQPDIDQNSCNYSPVSPLHEVQSNPITPKNRSQTLKQKTSSLCLGDFIVSKKPSSKKKSGNRHSRGKTPEESCKRITPTCPAQVKASEGFRKSSNSFDNFNTKEVLENVNGTRSILAEERLKILSKRCSEDAQNISAAKKIVGIVSHGQEIEPKLCSVTSRTSIDRVVDVYNTILKNHLVLNITSEIYYLISLLLTKRYVSDSFDDSLGVDFLVSDNKSGSVYCQTSNSLQFFKSIHNIIYFTVKCLESQLEVLKTYDKSTLKLLSDNKRLQAFSRKFSEKLVAISAAKAERIIEISNDYSQTNVCFNLDTDNRENFPNDVCFHSFRKQRDLFYEIIRIWEVNHVSPGWNFSGSLGGKIKSLFVLQGDSSDNFMHFSRLFKAQLLSTCDKSQREEGFSEDRLPFLSSLPNIDTNKLNLLKNRLVTKRVSSGLNSLPLFTGHQEFYKDFILSAANHAFNRHLCDTFISEIIELNDTNFSCTDVDESDTEVDPLTIKSFASILKYLRVLAKFLGFIESIPYKSDVAVSEKLLTSHIKLRSQITPSFDIKDLMQQALNENTVVLTIPWLVIYLAMLDFVTLRLPYYTSLYKTLFQLYRSYEQSSSRQLYNYNISLIRFSLGWLFELPHFPNAEYFNFGTSDGPCYVIKSDTLDACSIVDQNVLYMCCPYLDEVKKVLGSSTMHSASTVKHITPVSSKEPSDVVLHKRAEQQLEEAFFNGQPSSVKKTVDFVSERVASACVKHICNSVVPALKQNALQELKLFLESWRKKVRNLSPAREKSEKANLRVKVAQISQSNLSAIHKRCNKEVSAMMGERLPSTISGLLSVDSLEQTKSACVSIAARLCKARVKQWMSMHVNISIFTRDFDTEVQKVWNQEIKKLAKDKPIFAMPSEGSREEHDENSLSGFHMLEKIKNLTVDLIDDPSSVDDKATLRVLNETHVTLKERCDVNEIIAATICTSLVDFSLLLVINKNFIFTDDLVRLCMKSWECYHGRTDDLFANLLCARNVQLLNQSTFGKKAWNSFSKFVVLLIKHDALSCDNFEQQCTGFYKKQWDREILEDICYFFRCFIDFHKQNGGDASQFILLMEFFAEFCQDL